MELYERFTPGEVTMRPVMKLRGYRIMLFNLIAVSIVLVISQRCESDRHKISYPAQTPDTISVVFLPGIVSSDSFDFNAAYSPDGRSFYFSRRINKQSDIFVTHFQNGTWTTPVAAAFNTPAHSEADPAFDKQGRMYFISNRPRNAFDTIPDYDIWFATLAADGGWNAAEPLTIVNTDSSEFYISFSANGNLYFASSRVGGFGEEDLYVSRIRGRDFSTPENLGSIINTPKSEYDPGISPDEEFIVFTSPGRDDGFGGGDLYASYRTQAIGEWKEVSHLDQTINTGSREFCSYFSPDGQYFFYSSEGDVKWVDVNAIKDQFKKN